MRPVYKILLLFAAAALLWFGVPRILANTRPNMDVVIINKSGQPIAFAQLQTQTTRKDIRIHGIDAGAEVTVKFHNDSEDKFSLFVRFAEGREIREDGVYLEPGFRMLATVTESGIATERDLSPPPAREKTRTPDFSGGNRISPRKHSPLRHFPAILALKESRQSRIRRRLRLRQEFTGPIFLLFTILPQ